jgi:hypothetical protein
MQRGHSALFKWFIWRADFYIAFWIFCLLAWIWMRGERFELAAPLEPDTEPKTTTNPHINFEQ